MLQRVDKIETPDCSSTGPSGSATVPPLIESFNALLKTAEAGVAPSSFSIRNLPEADYHVCRDYVSASGLKALVRSTAHFKAWQEQMPKETTAAQRLGKALHAAVLEPEKFASSYCTYSGSRRGKSWQTFQAQCQAMEILTAQEFDQVMGMHQAIQGFDTVDLAEMIQASRCEQSLFWTDLKTGIRCRIRCDAQHENAIIDLKTTTDARPTGFAKQARQNNYDLQATHYVNGVEAFSGEIKPFWFIAVEVNPPHAVWIHQASEELLIEGQRRIDEALKSLLAARQSGNWIGYVEPWSMLSI